MSSNQVPDSHDNRLSDEEIARFLPSTLTASVCAVGGLFVVSGGTIGEIIGGVSLSVVSLIYIYRNIF